jgi:hydrolase, TatD family
MDTVFPDSHFHLSCLKERGIIYGAEDRIFGMDIGTEPEDYEERASLFSSLPGVRFTLGAGPWCTAGDHDNKKSTLLIREQALRTRPAAIGEIGLDYHWKDYGDRETQMDLLLRQLELANELELPVVVHSREADEDTISALKEGNAKKAGIIHCFSGGDKMLEAVLEMDYFISFSGNITYRANENLRRLLKRVPDDRLLLETDSPYLAPVPMRGRTNTPLLIEHIYRQAAELRGKTAEDLASLVRANLLRFWSLS